MTQDESAMMNMIQTMLGPLVSKLQTLEDKVDKLNTDRATRSDIERLQHDTAISFVPRDVYEARHAVLIERDTQLELQIRELRNSSGSDIKELKEYIDKALQRLGDSIKQQQEIQLSTKDRTWLRVSQWVGVAAIALSVLDWLSQHVKVQ